MGCVWAAGNLGSVMASSNGTLDSMRALGSISSGGVVPAAMQLAQRGALGAYPAAMLQHQYLPWLLRVQARDPFPASLLSMVAHSHQHLSNASSSLCPMVVSDLTLREHAWKAQACRDL